MEKKIKIWTVALIIALLPFVITLGKGVYYSIVGTCDSLLFICSTTVYGLAALKVIIGYNLYVYSSVYQIAAVIVILAIIRLVMLKRKTNNKQVK